jgi:hypothetical protein
MPETDQASQFMTALEPFYKVAYAKDEKSPPIFNMFRKKPNFTPSIKMNGHAIPLNENGGEHILNTSHASAIHSITGNSVTHNGQPNGDIETTRLLSNGEMNGVEPGPSNEDGKTFSASLLMCTGIGEQWDIEGVCTSPIYKKIQLEFQ